MNEWMRERRRNEYWFIRLRKTKINEFSFVKKNRITYKDNHPLEYQQQTKI